MIKFNESTTLWEVSYSKRHPKTRLPVSRRRKNIKSKSEASRVYRDLILEVEASINRSVTPTWAEIIEQNSTHRLELGHSQSTVYSYKHCLKKYTQELFELPINKITRPIIHDLLQKKFSDKNIGYLKYIMKCLRSTFDYGIQNNFISTDPTPRYKFKTPSKIQTVLTEPQIKSFLDMANSMRSEWSPVWTLAVYTGMRNGELYALCWENVNLEKGQIFVKSSWNKRDGFKETKSGDDRVVDISPALRPLLNELKELTGGFGFVLPRISKWDNGYQARELRMFLTGMGLPSIRFHDLRASWATILLNKGIPPIKVMAMGGWKDMETMMLYIRKAGIDVSGSLDNLILHEQSPRASTAIE